MKSKNIGDKSREIPDLSYADAVALKSELKDEIKSDVKNEIRRWILHWIWLPVTLIVGVLGFFGWSSYQGLQELQNKILTKATQDFDRSVHERFTEANVSNMVDRLLETRMADHIAEKLRPLEQKAENLKSDIVVMKGSISEKQQELKDEQANLVAQLEIQRLATSAKAGSRAALQRLREMNPTKDQEREFRSAVLKETEIFYDVDRNETAMSILVQADTLSDPGFSSDELVQSMMTAPDYAEGAINSLGRLKAKACVGQLCHIVGKSSNLRAAARATWALKNITGQEFRPLAFDAVGKWWERNQTNAAYNGNYTGYCNVVRNISLPPRPGPVQQAEQFVEQLNDIIATDPDALHARCLKAALFLGLGQDGAARKLLDDVRAKRSDYYWLYVWDAAAQLKTNNTDKAIELLNMAFDKSPSSSVENTVKAWNIFNPIQDNAKIHWPSKKIKNDKP